VKVASFVVHPFSDLERMINGTKKVTGKPPRLIRCRWSKILITGTIGRIPGRAGAIGEDLRVIAKLVIDERNLIPCHLSFSIFHRMMIFPDRIRHSAAQ
jgi:hypothetical protein